MVAAHREERSRDLDQGGLEGRDRGEHDGDDQDLATDARPELVAEDAQQVAVAVLNGLGGEHDLDGDGEDLEQQEDDDHTDDAGLARVLLAVLRLLVEVGRDVPAPVVEGGDERSAYEAADAVEVAEAEPAPRERRTGVVAGRGMNDGDDREDGEDRHFDGRHDPLCSSSDGDTDEDAARHDEEPERSDEGDECHVARGLLAEE